MSKELKDEIENLVRTRNQKNKWKGCNQKIIKIKNLMDVKGLMGD